MKYDRYNQKIKGLIYEGNLISEYHSARNVWWYLNGKFKDRSLSIEFFFDILILSSEASKDIANAFNSRLF